MSEDQTWKLWWHVGTTYPVGFYAGSRILTKKDKYAINKMITNFIFNTGSRILENHRVVSADISELLTFYPTVLFQTSFVFILVVGSKI